ncbi:MAG: hypothetical protein NT085_01435 [candidate division SR1 bacterium]|nr:hypothetical protein [candidate division SR1 bacterium]
MKIIFPKEDRILIPRSTKKGIKIEIEKYLAKQLGRHISTLQSIAIVDPKNPIKNGYTIYLETEEQNPQTMFHDIITYETNYFFGAITMKNSQKKFFFLADIKKPFSIGNEKILLDGTKEIKVYIKQ